jgi:hypothetical protein
MKSSSIVGLDRHALVTAPCACNKLLTTINAMFHLQLLGAKRAARIKFIRQAGEAIIMPGSGCLIGKEQIEGLGRQGRVET